MKNRFLILLTLLLASSLASAQSRMNASGHFHDARTSADPIDRAEEPALDTLHLLGNTVLRTINGYLTIDGEPKSGPVQLRLYSLSGEMRYHKEYSRMVNIVFSPSRRFVAFHDAEQIQGFNTVCLTSKSAKGSNVFAVDNAFNLAYFDEDHATVHWKDFNLAAPEPIQKVVIRENEPLFVGHHHVWRMDSTGLQTVFTAPEGRILDAMVDSLDLHVSTQVEEVCKVSYVEYLGHDLVHFQPQQSFDHTVADCNQTGGASASDDGGDMLQSTAVAPTQSVVDDGIFVYPNPSGNGIFHLRTHEPLHYEVCNGFGQVLLRGSISNGNAEIDLSGVAAGSYWLRPANGSRFLARQLVVQAK